VIYVAFAVLWLAFGGLAAWRDLNRPEISKPVFGDLAMALLLALSGPPGWIVHHLFYGRLR
jgi:hypothetical protein